MTRLALVGDFNEAHVAHRGIEQSLRELSLEFEWLPTERVTAASHLQGFSGVWCTPGSPYRSMDGALLAIRTAREAKLPFLGTCGGFQHAIIEYARDVLGWADADHAESAPGVGRSVIAPLACVLKGVSDTLKAVEGSKLARAYGSNSIVGTFQCSYGVNPTFAETLTRGPLRVSARDAAGDVRAIELEGHPFFVGTLFQPEREVLKGPVSPIVRAFADAARSLR